jgi:alkanesulfonate monooxygenase SsuD/methylene tetrahydromethanopterin reductase-like flavin-dependent oxidoreductase (luciferase family)
MSVEIGVFAAPDAGDHERTVEQVVAADDAGLDLVGIQDHPYQPAFLDTFSLLAFLAARTRRIRLLPDVANLPLRPPAMLAKATATIDRLSGGRLELGLGAGALLDRAATMGAPERSRGETVEALEEAIEVIRLWWSGEEKVSFDGRHYRLEEATPGPAPAHLIGIWIGAYGPRMLRLTGRLGDGWLPSLSYLEGEDIAARHHAIDEAARSAGRDPSEIRRALNVGVGDDWDGAVDRLARLVTEQGFETLILSGGGDDPVAFVRRVGEELAPRLREAVGSA